MNSQVVDTLTAKELMEEALKKISEDEVASIIRELGDKSRRFQSLLSKESLTQSGENDMRRVLQSVFCTRRKTNSILQQYPTDVLKTYVSELLYGSDSIENRFNAFCSKLGSLDQQIQFDLASELLHFIYPDTYWLWTKWMWDPRAKTGSLALVTMKDFELQRPTLGETYLRVGEAVVFVTNVGEAAGFQKQGKGLFGTDVYLALVYGIYIYTILKMRMTQEFNKVVPQLPELVRRLLGVYWLETKRQEVHA